MMSFVFKTAALAALGAAVEEHTRKHREGRSAVNREGRSAVSGKVRGGDSILEANAGASVTANANVMQQLFTQKGVEMGDDEGRGVFEWVAARSPRETQQAYDAIKTFSALESTQQKQFLNFFKNKDKVRGGASVLEVQNDEIKILEEAHKILKLFVENWKSETFYGNVYGHDNKFAANEDNFEHSEEGKQLEAIVNNMVDVGGVDDDDEDRIMAVYETSAPLSLGYVRGQFATHLIYALQDEGVI